MQTEAELEGVWRSLARGRPYGSAVWVEAVVKRLGLQSTMRPRGRPRKPSPDAVPDGGKRMRPL